jgi:catechol-2,3-dioxygenase
MTPTLKSIDHIHVFVANRDAARIWYEEVLGLTPIVDLEFWAKDGGPLTLSDAGGNVHIALFESVPIKCRSTIALGVSAAEFLAWKRHLSEKFKATVRAEDHEVSWSLYFNDPDGNPYEVTTYEYSAVAQALHTEA